MQRQPRKAFTLIEMLVVIVIILILVGVGFGAYVESMRHAALQRTNAALETAKSLFDGYKAADSKMAALSPLLTAATMHLDTTLMPTNDLDLANSYLTACLGPHHEHRVDIIEANDNSLNKNTLRAIDYTQQVMQVLLSVPENREIVNKLPTEQRYVITKIDPVTKNEVPVDPPLLADGNGEPIYFVPAAGLLMAGKGGTAGGPVSGIPSTSNPWPTVMRSDGRMHVATPDGTDTTPPPNPLPFWASAGHDDDLGAAVSSVAPIPPAQTAAIKAGSGDDNVYSFGK